MLATIIFAQIIKTNWSDLDGKKTTTNADVSVFDHNKIVILQTVSFLYTIDTTQTQDHRIIS